MHAGIIELNWSFLMILINVAILYFILKRFFWEKVRTFMLDRQAAVQDAFDSAEAINRRADEKMQNYSRRIANVEEESREIIRNAKARAEAQAKDIVENAHKEASDIIAKAERTIEIEREKATAEMRQEIAALAIMAAEQIVEKEISSTGQEAIVDEVINKARSTGWQN
ncbi:MAG: F0F1 ATP synthase subunit B [Clostridiales bacterium]|nr:F0F1 ATP synthase subunit B [Clostridiales bacterium]MDY4959259.1 F0F1 ATP synthase subunit B [Lentihominibacter sp.]